MNTVLASVAISVLNDGCDGAGRTTSVVTGAGTTTVAYDYEGRISQITYPSTATNTFTYNGLDTRVSKVDSAGTATYKRDGAHVTAPVISDGSAVYTPGISERRSSTTKYYGSDRLGTNALETNSSQAVTATKTYDAFGMPVGSTGSSASPFGFAGQHGYQEDADSGLKLLGHRYYDASTGRFLTRDPIKDGRNWYGYCNNNPLKWVDPDGLSWVTVSGRRGLRIRIDKNEMPKVDAHLIRPGGRPSTLIEANGDIPPTHGGKPNPPLTEGEKRELKEWGGMWPDVVKPMLEIMAERGAPTVGRIGTVLGIALMAGELLGRVIDGPAQGANDGLNAFSRQRWLDSEDARLL